MSGPANDLTIDRQAEAHRILLGSASWVDLVEGFVRDPLKEFGEIHSESRWAQGEVLRYDSYVPEKRLGAALRAETRPMLRQTELHLQSRYRAAFTGVGALHRVDSWQATPAAPLNLSKKFPEFRRW